MQTTISEEIKLREEKNWKRSEFSPRMNPRVNKELQERLPAISNRPAHSLGRVQGTNDILSKNFTSKLYDQNPKELGSLVYHTS